jgi:16S rRNA processing protein RimM
LARILAGRSVADQRVIVGRVSGLYGLQGWIKVFSYTSPPDNIFSYKSWYLQRPEQDGESAARYEVAANRRQGKGLVARFEGMEDCEAAAEWVGADILVERGEFAGTEKDEYYWADLAGLEVRTADGQVLGVVASLIETGANDVLVVEGDRRRLVPFLQGSVVKSVDLDARIVVVDWDPEF